MDMLQPLAAIALVFGMMAGAIWLLRRRGLIAGGVPRSRKAGCLSPIERMSLSPQHSVHLVRMADRALLIGIHPAGCSLLETMPWSEVEAHVNRGDK